MSAQGTRTRARLNSPFTIGEGAAPLAQQVQAQTRIEIVMALRNGESLLATFIIPVFFLLAFAFGFVSIRTANERPIEFALPSVLAVAVMSAGMVSLGIATAYERYYGVLKRLGTSPLPRWGLLVAKIISVLVVEVVQVALLTILALLFGWRPEGPAWAALPVLLLGTATFAGLGLLMAGALRAQATLGVANLLFLLFIGAAAIPVGNKNVPGIVGVPAQLTPATAFSDALRGSLSAQGFHFSSLLILLVWAVVILVAASRTFRWE